RFLPTIEAMEATSPLHDVQPRPKVQVVGIAKDDLRSDVVYQLVLMYRLDGARRTHWHKNGSFDGAMRSFDDTGTCFRLFICDLELKFHSGTKIAKFTGKHGRFSPETAAPSPVPLPSCG